VETKTQIYFSDPLLGLLLPAGAPGEGSVLRPLSVLVPLPAALPWLPLPDREVEDVEPVSRPPHELHAVNAPTESTSTSTKDRLSNSIASSP